jgi:uncharacterized membrane protein SpoIIM required for sporulation
MKKSTYDNFLFGIITGIIMQVIAFYIVLVIHKSLLGFTEKSVFSFVSYLMNFDAGRSDIIPKLLSLSAIGDLLLFFIYIWTDNLKSARGVIGSAFLLGIVIVIFKFI